mmetsp:Transcript_51105/g.119956  ORF Transcript_51105/g.119956 Transcript_51105/m.119956 type:complete len:83 (+) Transcript_51105:1423-1671(+)
MEHSLYSPASRSERKLPSSLSAQLFCSRLEKVSQKQPTAGETRPQTADIRGALFWSRSLAPATRWTTWGQGRHTDLDLGLDW